MPHHELEMVPQTLVLQEASWMYIHQMYLPDAQKIFFRNYQYDPYTMSHQRSVKYNNKNIPLETILRVDDPPDPSGRADFGTY